MQQLDSRVKAAIDMSLIGKSVDNSQFVSDEQQAAYAEDLIIYSALRNAVDQEKIENAHKPRYSDDKPLIEIKKDGDDIRVKVNLPGDNARYFKAIHVHTSEKGGKTYTYDVKTGFKGYAYVETNEAWEEINDTVRVLFGGSDYTKGDWQALGQNALLGVMNQQVPLAGEYIDHLQETGLLRGKKLHISGNSLGAQSAIYATAYAMAKPGLMVEDTQVIDGFCPGMGAVTTARAFAKAAGKDDSKWLSYINELQSLDSTEVAKSLDDLKNDDAFNAAMAVAGMLGDVITTFTTYPPTAATDPAPAIAFQAPAFMEPFGKNIQLVVKDPELLELAERVGSLVSYTGPSHRHYGNR